MAIDCLEREVLYFYECNIFTMLSKVHITWWNSVPTINHHPVNIARDNSCESGDVILSISHVTSIWRTLIEIKTIVNPF